MNTVVTLLFVVGVLFSYDNPKDSTVIWLGPLILTCVVFNIALGRIRSTIRSIRIAQSNERLTLIHFFNILIYTVVAVLARVFLSISDS